VMTGEMAVGGALYVGVSNPTSVSFDRGFLICYWRDLTRNLETHFINRRECQFMKWVLKLVLKLILINRQDDTI